MSEHEYPADMPPEVRAASREMEEACSHLTFLTAMKASADERHDAYRATHEAVDHFVDTTAAALRNTASWKIAEAAGLIPTTETGDPR